MPRLDEMGLECGFKVSADGLIHTVQRLDPPESGRRSMHNENSDEDPRVCLSCPLPASACRGERACYLMRKKLMEKEQK